MTRNVTVLEAGDAALVARFEARIDPAVNARAIRTAEIFRRGAPVGVRDVVVGYASVTVYFDPLAADPGALRDAIAHAAAQAAGAERGAGRVVDIPVRYGGADGPDLEEVAAFARCTPEEVVRLHAAPLYRVYMIGFVPGFPYLASVDPRIAMPRRETPRRLVPAGSVGIAGSQTGIYPTATPGGWRIIGRTDIVLFDMAEEPRALLAPGDRVRFVPVEGPTRRP
ncbi:MAG TPA: 5-oxoprolinase subunit PxpB [Vicinamibacterales bacterium]|nr:5-oxoprolinase subunit PxpB [Vicinamibacterales bacterium]